MVLIILILNLCKKKMRGNIGEGIKAIGKENKDRMTQVKGDLIPSP